MLSRESSAEPGRWRTARAEYQRGIMDAINDPTAEVVVVMKSAQVGWTEILNNTVGYYISYDPAPILLLQPTLEMAEAYSKDRLAPMLRDTPCLQAKVSDARSRDSGNTLLHKTFAGGQITMAGANSPASLASRPIRIVLGDEIDRYPASAGTEGDPITLARKRTATFWNRKILLGSTPTIKGLSRVEHAFEETDKRYYFLPCPACGHMQPLKWARIDFDSECHACEECGVLSSQVDWQGGRGEWRATELNPPNPKARGFHINELYSPWRTWGEIIADFKAAKGNTELLKAWVNTSLGETWEDEGETVQPSWLVTRCERYKAQVPAEALALTCGVDVQRDRLELETVGWRDGEESWSVDRKVLWGDPDKAEVWQELDEYLGQTFIHENGHQLAISATCIDSGGSNTQSVYEYCRGKTGARIFAIKGVAGDGHPVVSAPHHKRSGRKKRPVPLFIVGVDQAKATVYARLLIKEPGPGYCHFSHGHNDEEYFAQLCAEKLVTRYRRGFAKREWHVVRPNRRNESLDCRVYAYAALKLAQPNFQRLTRKLAAVIRAPDPEPVKTAPAQPAAVGQATSAPAADAAPIADGKDEAMESAEAALAAPDPVEKPREERRPAARQTAPKPFRKNRGGFVNSWR